MPARVYVCDASHFEELKKMLAYDPYLDANVKAEDLAKIKADEEANVIFVRQDYMLKDGLSVGLEREKCYLYLKAQDSFLAKAEAKLKKSIQSLSRADPATEAKVIAAIDEERAKAEQGLGSIFG